MSYIAPVVRILDGFDWKSAEEGITLKKPVEKVSLGDELMQWLRDHGTNAHRIAVEADMRPQTVERWLKGKSEASKRETVYGILDQINSGLERFGKRAEYRRGRDCDYLEIRDLPREIPDSEDGGDFDWLGMAREIQLVIQEEDPDKRKDLRDLIVAILHSTPEQRNAYKALMRGLDEIGGIRE